MTIRCVVIDDEPLARQRIHDLLATEEEFEIVGDCEDGIEALRTIPSLRPDVVFLDVQMPGLDGFEVLSALEEGKRPAIVFVTAFDTYAVRAFEACALDYLLKPLEAERFQAALRRVRRNLAGGGEAESERLRSLMARLERDQRLLHRIVVKTSERIFFIETGDVDWFEASGNYVRLNVSSQSGLQSHLVRMTMQSLEERLDPRQFARIHRGTIVNVARIVTLHRLFRGEYDVTMESGATLRLQRGYREKLKEAIGEF
jgi:two-component system LytT family response regulator